MKTLLPPPLLDYYHSDSLKPLGVNVWRMAECSLKAVSLRCCTVSGANRHMVKYMQCCHFSPSKYWLVSHSDAFHRLLDPFKPSKVVAGSTRPDSVGQPLKGQNTFRKASVTQSRSLLFHQYVLFLHNNLNLKRNVVFCTLFPGSAC